MKANRVLFALGVAGLMLGTAGAVLADHDRVLELREAGEIGPLSAFVDKARAIAPGRLLDAHLERDDTGRLVYEVELHGEDGHFHEVFFDARTGEFLDHCSGTEETCHAHPGGGG